MAPKHMGDQSDVSSAHIIPGEGRSRRTRSAVPVVAPPVLDLTSEDSESDDADHTDHTNISEDDSEDDDDDEDTFSSSGGGYGSGTPA